MNILIAPAVLACCMLGNISSAAIVYSETFDGPGVPGNWSAQHGSATLGIVDDTGGINTGNALSFTTTGDRQATIGSFSTVSLANVGDVIELSFDVRLTNFGNSVGGFRFGIYGDGTSPSSGYRIFTGTGTSFRTDVHSDDGDTDILFGTNRLILSTNTSSTTASQINNNNLHSFLLRLTQTTSSTIDIEVFKNGSAVTLNQLPVTHTAAMGAGGALKTSFNQFAISSALTGTGSLAGRIDNVQVEYIAIPEPSGIALALCAGVVVLAVRRRRCCR